MMEYSWIEEAIEDYLVEHVCDIDDGDDVEVFG